MKANRSTLLCLLSPLLLIVSLLISPLVFTAAADEAELKSASDRYVYASSMEVLFEEVVNWYPSSWALGAIWEATNADGNGILLLDLNEIGDYDVVEIGIGKSSANYLDFAFLTEAPAKGEALALVSGTEPVSYSKSGSSYKEKFKGLVYYVDIPEGANYLAIRAREGGENKTCPYSLAFERTDSSLLSDSLDLYAYPMDKVIPSMGFISESGTYTVDHYGDSSTALIPITGTVFDAVTFNANPERGGTTYAFLTEAPVPERELAFAGSMTANAKAADGETVKIPEDAKYLAVLYKKYNLTTSKTDVYLPSSITFVNWAAIPSTIETKTVAYTGLVEDGCVFGWNKDDYSHKWLEQYTEDYHTGFVDLTDRNYTKVSFTVSSGGYLGYAFLSETPVLGEKVCYTGGATAITGAELAEGTVVTASIPSDTTTIVVWMREDSKNVAPSAISLTYEQETEALYGLELKAAAEARLNANSGLRFTTRIPTAELAGIDYTVGTLIFPTDALAGALTVDTEGALNIKMTRGVVGSDYTYFSAAMTGIIAQNYARKFTAVSYIEVDGEYYYTAATSSSVYEAAIATYKENPTDAYADAVRAYIDGVVVIEDGKQVMPYDGYEHALTATITGNTLTITGEAALATVIIDGVIYTGGWTPTADGYTATTH